MKNIALIPFFVLVIISPLAVSADNSIGTVRIAATDTATTTISVLGYDLGFSLDELLPDYGKSNVEYDFLSEEIDLTDISVASLESPYIIDTTEDYDYIIAVIWSMSFNTTVFSELRFAQSPALTNGINVVYNGVSFINNQNITATKDFKRFDKGSLYNLFVDQLGYRTMVAGWPFHPSGLWVDANTKFQIYIQDKMTLINMYEFKVTIVGYKKVVDSYFLGDLERFYPNSINEITLQELYVGLNYNVKFTSNLATDGEKWINTSALQDSIHIRYTFQTGRGVNIVTCWLYQGNELLERRDLFIVPTQIDALQPLITTVVGTLAVAVAVGFIGKQVIYKKNNKPKQFKSNKKSRW